MTREERLELLKQIEKNIHVSSIESTLLDDAMSCAIHSAIKELEQETVSKESYDHEYFLRKELEMKIAKLEHDKNEVLDKIRAEIRKKMKFNSFNEGYVLYDDITEVLDKYKVESENKE